MKSFLTAMAVAAGICLGFLAELSAAETMLFEKREDGALLHVFGQADAKAAAKAGFELSSPGFDGAPQALASSGPGAGSWRTLEAKLELPGSLGQAGAWVKAARDGKVECRLSFVDAAGKRLEAISSTPSLYGSFGDWELLSFDLPDGKRPLTFTGISLRAYGKDVSAALGRIEFLGGASAKASAKRVWKLNDVDWRKPSSINFTGYYYEYGYGRAPYAEVSRLLPGKSGILPGDRLAEPDEALVRKETAKLEYELRRRNGELLWRGESRWPQDKLLLLPEPKELQTYFLTVKAFSKSGKLLALSDFAYQLTVNDEGSGVAKWPAQEERLGLLCDGKELKSSFACESPSVALLLRPPQGAASALLRVSDYKGGSVLDSKLALAGGSLPPVSLESLKLSKGRAYWAEASFLAADGTPIDYAKKLFGFKYIPEKALPLRAPGVKTFEDFFAGAKPGLTTEGVSISYDRLLLKRLPDEAYPQLVDQIASTGAAIAFNLPWGDLEPIEGVYQFDYIDALLKQAKSKGLRALVCLNLAGDSVPSWLWYDAIMTRDQASIGPTYRYVSPYSKRVRYAMLDAWRAIIAQYGADPAIVGWGVHAGGSEGLLRDLPPRQICDYSPAGKQYFREFLSKAKGLSLEQINSRYGTAWKSLGEVQPPEIGQGPAADYSLAARDFYEAKQALVCEHIDELTKGVRDADPERVFCIYSMFGYGDLGKLTPLYRQRRFLVMNGGAESPISLVMTQTLNEAGIPALPESHDNPPLTYNLNKVLFNNMLAGGFSGTNIHHGLVWAKNNFRESAELNALVPWKRKVVQELIPEMLRSSQLSSVGAFYSFQSSIFASKSFSPASGGPNFSSVFSALYGSFPSTPFWVTESSSPAFASKAKIIVDSDSPYLDARAEALLEKYVGDGGVFVATAISGREGDEPGAAYRWLKRLGCEVPQKPVFEKGLQGELPGGAGALRLESTLAAPIAKAGATTLVAAKDGRPLLSELPFGKGSVVFAQGEMKWSANKALMKYLLERAGAPPLLECSAEDVSVALLKNEDTGRIYLPAFREFKGKSLYVEREECLKAGAVDLRLKAKLPPGVYKVGSLLAAGETSLMDAAAIAEKGIELKEFYAGDLRILTFDKQAE